MTGRTDLKVARSLGWTSIVIGLAEIAGTRQVEKMLGVHGDAGLLRALGLREWLAGFTILANRRNNPMLKSGLWSRVAGDAMDLALLGAAARKSRRYGGLAFATAMVLGITAMDVFYAIRMQRERRIQGKLSSSSSLGGRLRSIAGAE